MLTDTKVSLSIASILTSSVDLGSSEHRFSWPRAAAYTDGAGAGQVNLLWHDKRTIAASSNDDIDLAGSLADALGQAVVFARVKALAVYAAPTNQNNVVVGGAAATQFIGPFGAATHTIAVQPGGLFVVQTPSAAGWVSTGGASDILRVANSGAGTEVVYDIVLLGAAS